MSTIAENIANIRAQMADAAKKAGRDPSEILLCAATKMNDADRVKEAVAAGVDCCGLLVFSHIFFFLLDIKYFILFT